MTPLPGTGRVIRDHAARLLARGALTLVGVVLLAGTEWIVSGLAAPLAPWTLAAVPFSAGALFAIGWRGVRLAEGPDGSAASSWVSLLAVWPAAHGLWMLGGPGLRRLARPEPGWGWLVLGIAWVLLGAGLLRDTLRVMEVARLARTMSAPAPEERPSTGAGGPAVDPRGLGDAGGRPDAGAGPDAGGAG